MRAVVLDGHGGPEALRLRDDVPVPQPAADELVVAVRACGACGHDLLARRGLLGAHDGAVLGHEIAGVVERTGPDVAHLRSGERVALVQRVPCGACPDCLEGATSRCRRGRGFYGEDLPGGYAERVIATERNAVRIPDGIDDASAAVLSCAVGTGVRALRAAEAVAGEVVLVTGASGGVGSHAVQVAAALGCRVIAATRRAALEPRLRELGADVVLAGDDHRAIREAARGLGRPRGVDVALEITGAPTFPTALRALGPGGRLVLVGNVDPAALPLEPGLAILKELRVIGSAHARLPDLREAVRLVDEGHVRALVESRWPLAEAAAAHAAMERGDVLGRAVLVP